MSPLNVVISPSSSRKSYHHQSLPQNLQKQMSLSFKNHWGLLVPWRLLGQCTTILYLGPQLQLPNPCSGLTLCHWSLSLKSQGAASSVPNTGWKLLTEANKVGMPWYFGCLHQDSPQFQWDMRKGLTCSDQMSMHCHSIGASGQAWWRRAGWQLLHALLSLKTLRVLLPVLQMKEWKSAFLHHGGSSKWGAYICSFRLDC